MLTCSFECARWAAVSPAREPLFLSLFLSGVCRKARCCASERNSPKTASLSCRCWKDILTLFDFWCRLMTSGKQTTSPTPTTTTLHPPLTSPPPSAGLYPSVIDRRSSPTQSLQSMTRAQSSPLCDCVRTVQYKAFNNVYTHTCTRPYGTRRICTCSPPRVAPWKLTGTVERLCISGQIGVRNKTKYVSACVGRWRLLHAWSPPVITSSSESRPLCTQVRTRGQRPENSLQIAFEVGKCSLDSSAFLILPLSFFLSVGFGSR